MRYDTIRTRQRKDAGGHGSPPAITLPRGTSAGPCLAVLLLRTTWNFRKFAVFLLFFFFRFRSKKAHFGHVFVLAVFPINFFFYFFYFFHLFFIFHFLALNKELLAFLSFSYLFTILKNLKEPSVSCCLHSSLFYERRFTIFYLYFVCLVYTLFLFLYLYFTSFKVRFSPTAPRTLTTQLRHQLVVYISLLSHSVMKFTTVAAVALAASTVVAQHDNGDTTFKSGKFNKTKASHAPTSSGTHKWGKFDKTKASHSPTSSGTHKWGKFNKTKASHSPTSTGTHKWGKFNKTKPSHAPTSSGTHKWGKFDKTKASHSPTSTGTHKWGKFNKTNKKQASENEAALAKMSSSFLVAGIAAFLL